MSNSTPSSSEEAKPLVLTRGREWPMENRIVPMEVLVLGMCRTGTFCMVISIIYSYLLTHCLLVKAIMMALKQLGYNDVYHMKEVFLRNDAEFWIAAMEAKYEGKGAEYGRKEWDHLLGDCMAVTDIPAAMFAAELVAAYPDAKVILTTRSVDSWYKSTMDTVYAAHHGLKRKIRALYQNKAAVMRDLRNKYFEHLWYNDFPRFGKRSFKEHNDLVRRVTPPERFLEYQVGEGWEPLCKFLDKEVPRNREFPFLNSSKSFQESDGVFPTDNLDTLQEAAKIALPVIAMGAAFWWRASLKAYFTK